VTYRAKKVTANQGSKREAGHRAGAWEQLLGARCGLWQSPTLHDVRFVTPRVMSSSVYSSHHPSRDSGSSWLLKWKIRNKSSKGHCEQCNSAEEGAVGILPCLWFLWMAASRSGKETAGISWENHLIGWNGSTHPYSSSVGMAP